MSVCVCASTYEFGLWFYDLFELLLLIQIDDELVNGHRCYHRKMHN